MHDHSSRPHRRRAVTPEAVEAQVEALRRGRLPCWKIAAQTGLSRATVARICKRKGLARLSALEAKLPVIRYEKAAPGEMIHIDIKKLGRIDGVGHRIHGDRTRRARRIGWEHLHVCVDDASRLAYTEILPDERKESACAFLTRALAFFQAHGVSVERVMTDNGSAYRSRLFKSHIAQAGLRHIRTRPYTPRTNGKAERFIQTSLREWAYRNAYQTSAERTQAMQPWITSYNHSRPHSALAGKPPISRLNNVLGFDT